jgi:hypothetical protein
MRARMKKRPCFIFMVTSGKGVLWVGKQVKEPPPRAQGGVL